MRLGILKFSGSIMWAKLRGFILVRGSLQWSILFELLLKNKTAFPRSPQWPRIVRRLSTHKIYDFWTFCLYWFMRNRNYAIFPDSYYLANSQWPVFYRSPFILNYQNSYRKKGLRNSLNSFYILIKKLKFFGIRVPHLIIEIIDWMRPNSFFIGCTRYQKYFKVIQPTNYVKQMRRSMVWNKKTLHKQLNKYFINRVVFNFFHALCDPDIRFIRKIILNESLRHDRGLIKIGKFPKRRFAYKKAWRCRHLWDVKNGYPGTHKLLIFRKKLKTFLLKYYASVND